MLDQSFNDNIRFNKSYFSKTVYSYKAWSQLKDYWSILTYRLNRIIDNISHFILNSFNVLDDNNFILGSRSPYVLGTLGVSANSSIDSFLIKFSSSDRSVQWVTSVDLDNNNDQGASISVFGSSLYFLLTSTNILMFEKFKSCW